METRILIVDDEAAIARAWARNLKRAGFAADVAASVGVAKTRLETATYDAILLDLNLCQERGEDLIEQLSGSRRLPAIAVVSGHLDSGRVVNLCGKVDLFVPKPVGAQDLIRVVRFLAAKTAGGDPTAAFCRAHGLSPRESEVLAAAAWGLQNKEIAARLGCELSTVITYWSRIFEKAGFHSRNEVLASMLHHGSADRA